MVSKCMPLLRRHIFCQSGNVKMQTEAFVCKSVMMKYLSYDILTLVFKREKITRMRWNVSRIPQGFIYTLFSIDLCHFVHLKSSGDFS